MLNWQKTLDLFKANNINTTQIRKQNIIGQAILYKLKMCSSTKTGIEGAKEIENKLKEYELKEGKKYNTSLNTTTIEYLCRFFDCQPSDLFEYVKL